MQERDSPQVENSDDGVLCDIHRLILDNTRSVAELLDEMGEACVSSQKPHCSASKRVKVSQDVTVFPDDSIELLNLPPALALLYYAAIVDATVKKTPNLLHILQLFAEPLPPAPGRCNVLYAEGLRRKEESARWREEQQKALMDKELKECTFKPAISDSAKELPSKGFATFMEKCIEWKKTAAMRLAKKVAQDRIIRGEDDWTKPWEMGERSRRLFEEFKKKGKKRLKLWEPKNSQHALLATATSPTTSAQMALSDGAATARRDTGALNVPSFHPVTCALVCEKAALLKHGVEVDAINTTRLSEQSDRSSKRIVDAYIERVETDIERRRKKLEKLRAQCAWMMENQLRDKKTGQPFFKPNALPEVIKNGVCVSFDELSKEDKMKCIKELREHHQEHVVARYFRSLRNEQEGKAGRQQNTDESLNDLTDKKKKRTQKVAKKFGAEETFHPQITAIASKIAARKSWKHIYDRPMPKPASQSSPGGSLNFTPNTKSSDACIQRMLTRSNDWVERRNRRINECRKAMELKATAECSFRPKVDGGVDAASATANSVRSRSARKEALVANAEARMWNELGVLRSRAAQRDASFVEALGRSTSTLTLLSAPRPSRRSVERYAQSVSIAAGQSPQSCAKLHSHQRWGRGTAASYNFPITYFGDDSMEDSDSSGFAYSSYDDYKENMCVDEEAAVTPDEMGDFDNDWAFLDAQTDLILQNSQYY